ncbi:hypothetical protein [Ruminococcus sp.]|uniref:hypothetical protein n=1 Tax=Ruminococcus sp. TaxID=41978 RepID=UPI003967C384
MKAKLLKHKKVLIVIGIVIVIFVLFNIFKPQIAKVVLNDDEQHVLALVQKVKKCAKGSQIGDDFSAYKKIDPCENDRFICYSVVYEIDDGLMVCCSIEHISSEKLSEVQGCIVCSFNGTHKMLKKYDLLKYKIVELNETELDKTQEWSRNSYNKRVDASANAYECKNEVVDRKLKNLNDLFIKEDYEELDISLWKIKLFA